ncbi:MAG: hypothetical protein QNK36_18255, partial [Colwellia sp.]|nr:hypothetical protein [Colwellia sp.]
MPSVLPLLMSFLLYSFSLVSLAEDSSSTAYLPSVKAPLASQSLLLDITSIGQNKLVAVGERGHIIISTDGVNWQQANVPVQTTLTNVFFYNEQLGWAVGHDSTILHS